MIKKLDQDRNLKGYAFEYIARIMLRRQNKNNFSFLLNRFDSIDEILTKYRLQIPKQWTEFINFARIECNRTDIIEFELNNNKERIVKDIKLYDVKTKNSYVERDYFEICVSNKKFMDKCLDLGVSCFFIPIELFNNWKFSFKIINYISAPKRVYSHFKKKDIII